MIFQNNNSDSDPCNNANINWGSVAGSTIGGALAKGMGATTGAIHSWGASATAGAIGTAVGSR